MKRKTKIALLIIWIISLGVVALAQNKVSLSIHQDATTDGNVSVITRFKMQGLQQKNGYLVVYPEFQYSELDSNFKRYSANIGYTFNQLVLEKIELSAFGGWGFIQAYGNKSYFSFSGSGELAYKITDNIKGSAIAQLTERKDLEWLSGNKEIQFSIFIGLEINLN